MYTTSNYQLSLWEQDDRIMRKDFNSDHEKIDAALATIAGSGVKFAWGTYTGDGTAERTIPLDFTPKAVYVCYERGYTYLDKYYYGGLAVEGAPCVFAYSKYNQPIVSVTEQGFQVYLKSPDGLYHVNTNQEDLPYMYVAFG
jgi:hypothetical protein